MPHQLLDIAKLKVGDSASLSRTISESDIYQYAGITGDMNPVHMDEEYARQTPFGGRIAHGMLCAGLVGAVMGMKLPGPGAIYQGQTLSFLAPVRIGDTITATAEIIEIGAKKKSAQLKTTCINQNGVAVLEGVASVLLPRRKRLDDTTSQ
jgi:3-hydroxybutyryl-CoA dehydratase